MGAGKTRIKLGCSKDQKEKAWAGTRRDAPSSSPCLLLPKLINATDMNQPRPRYVVDRAAYSLTIFDDEFEKKDRAYPVGEKIRHAFR
jgi:hypothetical protein